MKIYGAKMQKNFENEGQSKISKRFKISKGLLANYGSSI